MGFKNNNLLFFVVFISAVLVKEATCAPRKLVGAGKTHRPLHISKKAVFGANEPQQLTTVCQKTDYSALCVQSVTPVLHGAPADPVHLLTAEIEATTLKLQKANEKLQSLSTNRATPKLTLSAYDICKQQYDSAIDSLNVAKSAVSSHDFGTLNSELSAVITDASTCEDTFAENPDTVSPFTDTDEELSHLGSNCLAIAELIKW